jgi:hypothetical protein
MIRYNHSKENKKSNLKRMVKIMFREDEARKEIEEIINGMGINEQYSLYCEYCERVNYGDDSPLLVEDIDELFYGMKPSEILDKLGGLNTSWEYFCYNGYGHVKQWEGIDCVSEVVDYIIENENELENDDIQEVLDKYTSTQEFYIEKEDVNKVDKVVQELESQGISYEYDEGEAELKIFSDDYDEVTKILDELEIEY